MHSVYVPRMLPLPPPIHKMQYYCHYVYVYEHVAKLFHKVSELLHVSIHSVYVLMKPTPVTKEFCNDLYVPRCPVQPVHTITNTRKVRW